MPTEDFADSLPERLHAALDRVSLPERDWSTMRRELSARAMRRRARAAAASATAVLLVALAVTATAAGLHHRGHVPVTKRVASLRVRQMASVSLGGILPPQLAYGGGQLFAATDRGHLLRLDPVSLKVTGRLLVGRPPASASVGAAPMPVAYGDRAVWVLNLAARQLWRVDPASMRVTMRRPAGTAFELAYGGGSLWLTMCCVTGGGTSSLRLERINPATGRVSGSVSLPGDGRHGWGAGAVARQASPIGVSPAPLPSVVLAAGRVIMVAGPNAPVFVVNPRDMAVLRAFHVGCDGCEKPLAVAIGPAGLYATSIDVVVRLDLASGEVVAQGPPGGLGVDSVSPAPLVAGPGGVWLLTEGPVPCALTGYVAVLDPVTLAVAAGVNIQADGSVLPVGRVLYATDFGRVVRFGRAGR